MTPSAFDAALSLLVASLRVLPTVALLPALGAGLWSWPLRVAVALVLTLGATLSAPALTSLPRAIGVELLVGATLALVLALPFAALDHAARLWSAGDPIAWPAARALPWTGAAAFLASGGHHGALRVLAATWTALPPGATPRAATPWLDAAIRATGESLSGALTLASAGLVALAATELVSALSSRLAWSLSRDTSAALVAPVRLLVAALALRWCAEVATSLAARAFDLASALSAAA